MTLDHEGHADRQDDGLITCWCGAAGTFEELFDSAVFQNTCGGLGILECRCGGEFCVCHHHGQLECPGCADCECDDDEDPFGDGLFDEE